MKITYVFAVISLAVLTSALYLKPNNSIKSIGLFSQQKVYQYMAVCTDGHGVLSSWKDLEVDANKFGKDHEVLTKGHRWRIDKREKPIQKKDSATSITLNH